MVKISVIIPVYNAEQYLRYCLDSIVAQDFNEYEVICVNDGSTDGSAHVLDEYCRKDKRFVCVYQGNAGAGPARNLGLRMARGKYVCFIDPDDAIGAGMFSSLYEIATKHSAEVVVFRHQNYTADMEVCNDIVRLKDEALKLPAVFSGASISDKVFNLFMPSPWNKFYLREFLDANDITFQNLPRCNDVCFGHQTIALADRIHVENQCWYKYRTGRHGSSQNTTDKDPTPMLYAYGELMARLKRVGAFSECAHSFAKAVYNSARYTIQNMKSEASIRRFCEELSKGCGRKLFESPLTRSDFQSDWDYKAYLKFVKDGDASAYLRKNKRANAIPVVSVIVPVYNVQEYIKECLTSIAEQTLKEIEVICVDDGSTDKSLEIMKGFAKRDLRFKVLHQENSGAGIARNAGLDAARGEFVCFFDPDDYVSSEMLEVMVSEARKEKADIVACKMETFDDATRKSIRQSEFSKSIMDRMDSGKCVVDVFEMRDEVFNMVGYSPCDKIIRRNIFEDNDIRFQDLRRTNDCFGISMALVHSKRLVALDKPFYHYRRGIESTTTKEFLANSFCKAFQAVKERLCEENLFENYQNSFVHAVMRSFMFNLRSAREIAAISEIYEDMRSSVIDLVRSDETEEILSNQPMACAVYREILSSDNCHDALNIIFGGVPDVKSWNEPAVSVIIPVYNVEKYLAECLDSIVNQTLYNIEIICIDDGSTDKSSKILAEYARNDKRFVLKSQSNQGQGAARNKGIKCARGKYIYFMDSDDILEKGALSLLVGLAETRKVDHIVFTASSFADTEDKELKDRVERFNKYYAIDTQLVNKTMPGKELLYRLVKSGHFTVSPPLRMIRREVVVRNGCLFPEGIKHEDEGFALYALYLSGTARMINKVLYKRRVREGSTVTATDPETHLIGIISVIVMLIESALFSDSSKQMRETAESVLLNLLRSMKRHYGRDAGIVDKAFSLYVNRYGEKRKRQVSQLFQVLRVLEKRDMRAIQECANAREMKKQLSEAGAEAVDASVKHQTRVDGLSRDVDLQKAALAEEQAKVKELTAALAVAQKAAKRELPAGEVATLRSKNSALAEEVKVQKAARVKNWNERMLYVRKWREEQAKVKELTAALAAAQKTAVVADRGELEDLRAQVAALAEEVKVQKAARVKNWNERTMYVRKWREEQEKVKALQGRKKAPTASAPAAKPIDKPVVKPTVKPVAKPIGSVVAPDGVDITIFEN